MEHQSVQVRGDSKQFYEQSNIVDVHAGLIS